MTPTQTSTQEYMAQNRWLRILSDYRESLWPCAHVRERRRRKRVQLHAKVLVEFQPPGQDRTITLRNCPLLDASNESLAISVYQKIPLGTRLSLVLSMGGKHYALTGVVAQSSGFLSPIRVGILLQFPAAPDGDSAHTA